MALKIIMIFAIVGIVFLTYILGERLDEMHDTIMRTAETVQEIRARLDAIDRGEKNDH